MLNCTEEEENTSAAGGERAEAFLEMLLFLLLEEGRERMGTESTEERVVDWLVNKIEYFVLRGVVLENIEKFEVVV